MVTRCPKAKPYMTGPKNGKQVKKYICKGSCPHCKGSSYLLTCPVCEGAGLKRGGIACETCGSTGMVPKPA